MDGEIPGWCGGPEIGKAGGGRARAAAKEWVMDVKKGFKYKIIEEEERGSSLRWA